MKFHVTGSLSLVLVFLITGAECMIQQIPLPDGLVRCFSTYREKTSIVDTVGESIASFCFGQYMWQASRERGMRGFNISTEAYNWAQTLLKRADLQRHKRQAPNLRVRKEYRRLTDVERANFHTAINMMKTDTSVRPNMYDALSAIHQGVMNTAAHGGPNFLSFHRIYLIMFENALRQKVPSVTVPYWDSTLDQAMFSPTQSLLFTDPFLGNGFGIVRTGPFARWGTLSGPLIRNIGQSGQLFNSRDIARIVSMARLSQITEPNAPVNSSLEFLHNQVHLWIDGQMGSLETASHDPVFWMHHAYVDYIWEIFRNNQRRYGIDPTTDYPVFVNHTMHMPLHPMGLSNFRNIDGMSDVFTSALYTYEPTPRCSMRFPDCGTPYLQCVLIGFRTACVSLDWSGFARATRPQARQPVFFRSAMQTRQNINMAAASQFQRQAMAASSAFAAQTQMRMRMSQRRFMQKKMLQRMRRPPAMAASIMDSEGGAGGEEFSEGSHMRKRRALFPNGPYQDRKPAAFHHELHPTMDNRGRVFENAKAHPQSNPNIDVQRQMFMQPLQTIQQEIPAAVRNNSGGQVPFAEPPVSQGMCPNVPATEGYQNTFNVNGRSDIHQWVYVPVKVIYQRPPTYSTYSSFPVVNGQAEEAEDIYSTNPNANMTRLLQMGKPASYSHCRVQESGSGKVYISSQGLNYMGTYKEYAIVDHRLTISIATAYVAVKSPEYGASEVFLNAYDSCGRVCQPYCRVAGSGPFQRCSGAFRLTSQRPKLYGANYGDAVTSLWQFSSEGNCPLMHDNLVHVQFHCNFRDAWPFAMFPSAPGPTSRAHDVTHPPIDEYEEPETPMEGRNMSPLLKQTPSVCSVGSGCIIASDCKSCRNGQTFACIGACTEYAACHHGALYLQSCPGMMWYSPVLGTCVEGTCTASSQRQWWHKTTGWK